MNRIKKLFARKNRDLLNVYFTAGYPQLDSMPEIMSILAKEGADIVELGIPYSDPLADGLTIQKSSEKALKNGMTLEQLFRQLSQVRKRYDMPIMLMGYYNQMLQYGPERFLKKAKTCGADGLIIPDLPMDIYESEYQSLFDENQLTISFLITPQTSDNRIMMADKLSSAFVYVVSKSSITGGSGIISNEQKAYFERIAAMNLKSPRLIGFGIHDRNTFRMACKYAHGAIIGSAFIRALSDKNWPSKASGFIRNLKSNS